MSNVAAVPGTALQGDAWRSRARRRKAWSGVDGRRMELHGMAWCGEAVRGMARQGFNEVTR